MFKKIILSLLIIPCFAFAGPLWHCTANNAQGAVWNEFGQTEIQAHSIVEKKCTPFNKDEYCPAVCFPPREYWRCVSHDTLSAIKAKPGQTLPKQGSWFWTSFSKQVAINGARDACRHNSAFGGCYVDPKACAES